MPLSFDKISYVEISVGILDPFLGSDLVFDLLALDHGLGFYLGSLLVVDLFDLRLQNLFFFDLFLVWCQ